MQEYLEIFLASKMFSGMTESEILAALNCLNARVKPYAKNSAVFNEGDSADFIGIILLGEVQTQKNDYSGNANIISKLYPADILAASACYCTDKHIPFDVICASDCLILCLDAGRLIRTCCNACAFHIRLVQNMLGIIADRNIHLAGKIDILTKRTLREKILTYLYSRSKKSQKNRFIIPLSRRQMAEYLSVNRSALSRELCNLQNEGLIEFDGNVFILNC